MQGRGLRPCGLIVRLLTKPTLVVCQNETRYEIHLKVLILLIVNEIICVEPNINKELCVAHLVPLSMDSKLDGIKECPVNVPLL